MKTWQTIIVDDEPLARLELKRLLQPFQQINLVGEADSVGTAVECINQLQPDLIFLDIDLGTQSGFDLLEVSDSQFHTIFVTAYDKYAIRAFEINALDYLLKPVHPERMKKTIERLGHPFREEKRIELTPNDKILLGNSKSSRFISVKTIEAIKANGDYSIVYTCMGFKAITHTTLKKWLEKLPPSMFLQVHRSYIVNITRVKEIQKNKNGNWTILLLHTQQTVSVGRQFQKALHLKFKV